MGLDLHPRRSRHALGVATGLLMSLLHMVPAGAAPCQTTFCPNQSGPCIIAQSCTITTAKAIYDFPERDLVVKQGAEITVNPGPVTITARSVLLEPTAKILGTDTGMGSGATISITSVGTIWLQANPDGSKPALIDVTASSDGGEINLTAGGNIQIDGQLSGRGRQEGFGGMINLRSTGGDIVLNGSTPIEVTGGFFAGNLSVTTDTGSITVNGTVDATGGEGGAVDFYSKGDFVSRPTGKLDCSATADGGFAGSVMISAGGGITLNGGIIGNSRGNDDAGGGAGGVVELSALNGSVLLASPIDLTGGAPDGEGGFLTIDAALDIRLDSSIVALGKKPDGCGGDVVLGARFAPRALTMGAMDLSGGSCGGGRLSAISRGNASVGSGIDVNADGTSSKDFEATGGDIDLSAQTLDVAGRVHANGLNGGTGGQVTLHGCTLTTQASALVSTTGNETCVAGGGTCIAESCVGGIANRTPCGRSENLLQANGPMAIGGTIQTQEDGKNRLEYATQLPTLSGTIVPAPTRVANLEPCVPPPTTTTTTSASTTSTTTTAGTTSTQPSTTTTPTTTLTTTTAPTTKATTTTAPTTTVTSATTGTSITTTVSTTTSTTTLPAVECTTDDPFACDDDDVCTKNDRCVDGRCVHDAVGNEIDGVTCQLENIDVTIGRTPEKLGGQKTVSQLVKKINKARQMIDAIAREMDASKGQSTARSRRAVKRANKFLRAFIRTVNKNRKVDHDLKQRIVSFADDALAKLTPLTR